jgi:hypothetical protein
MFFSAYYIDVVTEENDREKETKYIRSALSANGFPNWAMNIPEPKAKTDVTSRSTSAATSKINIPIPYVQGVSERLKRVFDKHGVRVYHKPVNTIRQQLVHPKDPPIENKCGVIYKIKCDNCEHKYIGETARTLGTRVKEHLNTKKDSLSAVGEHCKDTGHTVSWANISVTVVGREEHWYRRKIMEAIEISEGPP